MCQIFRSFSAWWEQHNAPKPSVFFVVFLCLLSSLTLAKSPAERFLAGHQHQNEDVLCTPATHTPTPTYTPTATCTPTITPIPITTPEFGTFEPSNWVTLTNSPLCSIETRDVGSGLDTTSARYRWSSSGSEYLQQQAWLSATVSSSPGTTERQFITVTVPFTQDSSSCNLVQFAITNIAGYSATSPVHGVKIDTTPPGPWWGFTRIPDWSTEVGKGELVTYTIMVSDATSGLKCSTASYQFWTGVEWSGWEQAECAEAVGITSSYMISAPNIPYISHSSSLLCDNENKVMFQVADQVGHASSALRQEEYCVYFPAVMRCYPPCLSCYPPSYKVPRNGDFAVSGNGFAADWGHEFFQPPSGGHLVVVYSDYRIFMGYDNNEERLNLPGSGQCAFARLYQDFYLPYGCHDLQLHFAYQLLSYDYDRSSGDVFRVYIDDLDSGIRYSIYDDRSHQTRQDSLNGKRYDSGWTTQVKPLPVSAAGGQVRLWFEVLHCEPPPRKSAWWPTWVYLDNVTITDQP